MKLRLAFDAGRARNWHQILGATLSAQGHEVSFLAVPLQDRRMLRQLHRLDQLLAWERRIYAIKDNHAFAGFSPPQPPDTAVQGLCIDLTSAGCGAETCLFPLFRGMRGELGMFADLTHPDEPLLAIMSSDAAAPLLIGHPAIENREIGSYGLGHLAMAAAALLAKAVERIGALPDLPAPPVPEARLRPPAPLHYGAAMLVTKIMRNLRARNKKEPPWRIAWRRIEGDAMQDTGRWPQTAFTTLADDGQRYFADPFIFVEDGVAHVFCEEYPFATRKGIISHFTLDRQRGASAVRPVLELPFHISYPQVFAFGGEIYMLPEASASHKLELYRARHFPDDWLPERVLIDNADLADATFLVHAGRCWIFATRRLPFGSSWDQLVIYSAPHPLGPWTAHRDNPACLDARSARPAGNMWMKDGTLYRIAQDCTGDYGRTLSLLRVDHLDEHTFHQTQITQLTPPPATGWRNVHTLNTGGGFEIIDYIA